MPDRPRGTDPPARSGDPWTRADVERGLKAAFRAMPFTPIYAPRGNTLEAVGSATPDATFDIVAFSGTVLGDRSLERRVVLLWARAIATGGEVGGSIAEFCRERDWDRSVFDRMRIRSCEKIAQKKNQVDCRYEPPT